MKKIVLLLLIIFALVAYIIFSKTGNKYDIESAKQALEAGNTPSQTINAGDSLTQKDENNDIIITELSNIIAEGPNFIIEKITSEQFISLSAADLASANFTGEAEIEIKGTADLDVESIDVAFRNTSSDFPDDLYTLQNFTAGEAAFKYRASPLYKVLDFGENTYIFTAKTPTGESKTKLTITTSDTKSDVSVEENTSEVSGSINELQFPKGDFGEAIISNDTTAYYSDLKGLEIQKTVGLSSTICEAPEAISDDEEDEDTETPQHSITKFLLSKYNTWVYWNTCRPTVTGKGISFYVLRLTGDDTFKYEKHYLDYDNELHGIQELKTGTGVTKDNIGEKNTELKSESFDITPMSDELFKKIITENKS